MEPKKKPTKILFEDDDVLITEDDVDRAIEIGRQRLGDEFAELLEGKPVKKPISGEEKPGHKEP
jgi:hypothetical protein